MSKLAQAMSRTFPIIHPETKQTVEVAGRNMSDKALEKYSASNKQELAADARLLLDESYATQEVVDGVRRTVRVPHQAPPDVPEDDGFGPVGVTAQAPAAPIQVMPKAVVPAPQKPAPAPWDAETPEWAKEIFAELRVLGAKVDLATDASTTVMEKMAEIAKTVKAWASDDKKTTAPGVGQGAANGGGQFVTETIEASKNKGKLSFKVKGGRFSTWGVIVWPEVMEAHGFKLTDFPVGEEVKFPGHTAIFTFKEQTEEGKQPSPDKIVRFIRCDK